MVQLASSRVEGGKKGNRKGAERSASEASGGRGNLGSLLGALRKKKKFHI